MGTVQPQRNLFHGPSLSGHSVADPGFSRRGGGASTLEFGGKKLLFGKIFAENCMIMKLDQEREGRVPSAPFGSANGSNMVGIKNTRQITFVAFNGVDSPPFHGLNTLPDSDTGTDSDSDSCPMQK